MAPRRQDRQQEEVDILNPPTVAPRKISRRFSNDEEREAYKKISKWDVIEERGFNIANCQREIIEEVRRRGWGNLVAQPIRPNISLAKECFSIISTLGFLDEVITVRGVEVDISPAAINDLYQLRGITIDYGTVLGMRDDVIKNGLASTLAEYLAPGVQVDEESGRHKFGTHTFSALSKMWHRFICSRISPTSRQTVTYVDEAALVFAILSGFDIDIGQYIFQNLFKTASSTHARRIPYPSLLTHLCLLSHVPIFEDDLYLEIAPGWHRGSFKDVEPQEIPDFPPADIPYYPPQFSEPLDFPALPAPPPSMTPDDYFRQDFYSFSSQITGWLDNQRIQGQNILDRLPPYPGIAPGVYPPQYQHASTHPYVLAPWSYPGAPTFQQGYTGTSHDPFQEGGGAFMPDDEQREPDTRDEDMDD